jgi:endonuclease-3
MARALAQSYPDAKCSLDYANPLQLLIATILSAQCTDARVNKVTPALFARYADAKAFGEANPRELERLVQSTGFFRNKAKSIQGCSLALVERHGGEVPKTMAAMLELPGVARKTANVVLGIAHGVAAGIVVDTHVTRVAQRLGLSRSDDAETIEQDLCAAVPQAEWIATGHRLLLHGRYVCTAKEPKCEQCPLNELCPARMHAATGAWPQRAAWEQQLVATRGGRG